LLVSILLISACEDIPRDNLLDPQNPDSYTSSIILLEAFVNTNNPLPYNLWALEALDEIGGLYGTKIVIAEYHRNTSQYNDTLANTLVFEPIYENYVENSDPNLKGVPDIFINGIGGRVQGASGTSNVSNRLNNILTNQIILNNYFTLEPGEITVNSSQIFASCKIARLGNQSSEDLLLRIILIQNIDNQYLKRVVTDVKKSNTINNLNPGEITTISFDPIIFAQRPQKIIFSLTSADELTVYQNIEVDL
jgi:hypothetical protein